MITCHLLGTAPGSSQTFPLHYPLCLVGRTSPRNGCCSWKSDSLRGDKFLSNSHPWANTGTLKTLLNQDLGNPLEKTAWHAGSLRAR